MKKIIAILLLLHFGVFAQSGVEQIKNKKINFIINYLELKQNQVYPFLDTYNHYKQLIANLKIKKNEHLKRTQILSFDEQQAKQIYLENNRIEKKIADLRLEMDRELTKILSYKQLLLLDDAENIFKNKLLQQLKK